METDFTISAIVVHKAEPWNTTEGSLLLAFEEWGTTIWLKPEQIKNYDGINHFDNINFQEFLVSDFVYYAIQHDIRTKREEVLKYKKK